MNQLFKLNSLVLRSSIGPSMTILKTDIFGMFLLGCLFYLPGSLFIQTIWFGWTDLESVNLYWIYSLIWMLSCICDWIHCFILKKEKNLVFQGRNFRAFMMINCVLSFEYISDWIPQKQTMIMTKMNGTDQIESNKNAIEFWFPEISMSLMEGNFFLSFFFFFSFLFIVVKC